MNIFHQSEIMFLVGKKITGTYLVILTHQNSNMTLQLFTYEVVIFICNFEDENIRFLFYYLFQKI